MFKFSDPIISADGKQNRDVSIIDLIKLYVNDSQQIDNFIKSNTDENFTEQAVSDQIAYRIKIISAIESYLLAYSYNSDEENIDVNSIADSTFAYYLGNTSQKEQLVQCFQILSDNIQKRIPEQGKRNAFGRTMYGLWTTLEIENWVENHLHDLMDSSTQEILFSLVWDLLEKYIDNSQIKKCEPKSAVREVAFLWIQGSSFKEIFDKLQDMDAKRKTEKRAYTFTIENVVDMCENGLAYEGSLIVGAIIEMLQLLNSDEIEMLINNMKELQKRIKYGLSTTSAIMFYELGFVDRVISSELTKLVNIQSNDREELITQINRQKIEVRQLLINYPRYFLKQLDLITR